MVLERNLRKFTRNGWSRCLKLISTFSLARNENCVVDGLGGGCAIAWKATDASVDDAVDDTVDGIFDVGGLAGRYRVSLLREERRLRVLDVRLTAKHGDGTVVVVGAGRAIALKATDASVDDTVDGIFDVGLAGLGLVVLSVAVKCNLQSNLLKLASLASNC